MEPVNQNGNNGQLPQPEQKYCLLDSIIQIIYSIPDAACEKVGESNPSVIVGGSLSSPLFSECVVEINDYCTVVVIWHC